MKDIIHIILRNNTPPPIFLSLRKCLTLAVTTVTRVDILPKNVPRLVATVAKKVILPLGAARAVKIATNLATLPQNAPKNNKFPQRFK